MNAGIETLTPLKLQSASAAGDKIFKWLTAVMAFGVFLLILLICYELSHNARSSVIKFGWRFLISSEWDPVKEKYGALPFIYGTLISSAIALLIAVPLSVATAIYLTQIAPSWLSRILTFFLELLAAIPSVILGLWGIFVMVPWCREQFFPLLEKVFGFLPIFKGPIYGISLLAGGMIISVMILPIITSLGREIMRSVPPLQREAAYALGATPWEVTRIAVLPYAKKGLFAAAILGLGRALGETMAVTMVIGNRPDISKSLFAPGYTLASVIANEFTEATSAMYLSALFEIGLVLLAVTVVVNACGRLLLKTFSKSIPGGVH